MKSFNKLIVLSLAAFTLSACSFMDAIIPGNNYPGYEEYLTEELKYKKFTDMDSFNSEMNETSYFWSLSESDTVLNYYTGKSLYFSVYKEKDNLNVHFTTGKTVYISKSEAGVLFVTDEVNIKEDGSKLVLVPGQENSLNVAKDDEGYLVVAYEQYMFYVLNDLKTFYVNEKNTSVFQGYIDTKTIPESELLTNTLEALGKDKRLQLPAPEGDIEIWYGLGYYKEKPAHGTALIANVHPNDYVKILKEKGFTVNRSFEDPYYAFYGFNGGYWYCFDEKEEMEVIIRLVNYLYTNKVGKTYGPFNNTEVWFYRMRRGYSHEKETTKNEAWDASDLATMRTWYDGTIDASVVPFAKLGRNYYVPSSMSYAHSGILDGTLAYHHECYNITDNSPYYLLDGYDQILENNGFHKYQPNYDLTIPEQKSAFYNTEECKYVECFINQEKDIAVKYYFDVNNGNTIRVFKLSEMKSWLTDQEK